MSEEKDDLIGKTFNRLTVIERGPDYINPTTGKRKKRWICECSCKDHNRIIVFKSDLTRTNKATKSCGCLNRERTFEHLKERHKVNIYDLSGEYGIGYSSNTNEEFYFDLEDYDKIKDICWCVKISDGFKQLSGWDSNTRKNVLMHCFLGYKYYDHIDRNELNNRKNNLRRCTEKENLRNKSLYKNNKSNVTGVCWHKKNEKWTAGIRVNKIQKYLGSFSNKEDAIIARLKAEKLYFGEFAPQKHLYDKYNI